MTRTQIEVIETKTVKHIIEVNSGWPVETQTDENKAKSHLKEAINEVGLDAINKLEEIIVCHEVTIDDEEF